MIKIPERRQWRGFGVFLVNFEHVKKYLCQKKKHLFTEHVWATASEPLMHNVLIWLMLQDFYRLFQVSRVCLTILGHFANFMLLFKHLVLHFCTK